MRAEGFDSADWNGIVARLGGEERLEVSARATGALTRAREVRSAADLLRLAFMYGPGGQSLRSLAATAGADGLCQVSDVALLKRLRRAKDWLAALCRHVLCRNVGVADAPCPSTRPLRLVDSTPLQAPARPAFRLPLAPAP